MIDSLNQFHFIRPLWLLGLIIIPFIWWLLRKHSGGNNDWKKVIHPQLLKHLTPKALDNSKQNPSSLACLLVFFCVLSIAGPSWEQKPSPVLQTGDDLIILLDLSLSVLATDVTPDRITKAKQKLQDILDYRNEGNTALIVFSGDAHVVTPLTDDINTILANLKALDPFIMPVIGSRPDIAVQLALELFEQANSQNPRLLMITDGVEDAQGELIIENVNDFRSKITLSILAIGTEQGGPIPIPGQGYLKDKGQVILPKTDLASLKTLALNAGGYFSPATLNDADINLLGLTETSKANINSNKQQTEPQQRFYDVWEDMGFIFLLVIIPLALFGHRKNILLSLLLFSIYPSENAYAFGWQDLWLTKDQQAQKLLDQGETIKAAELFESSEHKAHAYYKAEQFEQAEKHYTRQNNANSLYNEANSLAKQQKFQEALQKYEEALAVDPEHEDSLYNKKIIEKLLEQQQNQDQQNQDQQNQDQQKQDQQNQDQQNQDQQKQEQQKQDQQEQDQQEQDQQLEEMKEEALNEMETKESLNDEEKQSYEQWMRRVPDDPGALLRRKFEQQAHERAKRQNNARKEGEPIW